MNSTQKSVIQKNLAKLCNEIDVYEILPILRTNLVLTDNHVQIINNELTATAKRTMLLDLIQNKDRAWEVFLDALIAANQSYLADLLKDNLKLEYSLDAAIGKRRVEGQTVLDPLYQALLQQLRQNIIKDCEIIRQAWEDYLPVTSLALAFQKLQVIGTNGCRTKEISIDSYDYLIDRSQRIFLIEGDPGIGKSTYVNKIAMDWANGNNVLNRFFDFVIRLAWLNIENDWKAAIACELANDKFANCVMPLLETRKTLIIMDGYDESPSEKILKQICENQKPETGNRMEAILVITTRGTHVHHFTDVDKMWLRVLGFGEEAAANFIELQLKNTKTRTEEILKTHSSLIEIYKNPLYATMIAATELTSKLFEMEPQVRVREIFEQFAALQKERYFRKYQDITEEKYDELKEKLGLYAFKFLDSDLREYFRQNYEIRENLTELKQLEKQWLKFGFVQCFKKKMAGKFLYEITFLHQTFAEYHAANYAAKHAVINIYPRKRLWPEFFWSLLLAQRLDLLLEKRNDSNNRSDNYWFHHEPSVALPLQKILDFILSNRVTGVELDGKDIDIQATALISEVHAEEIKLINCTLNCISLVSLKTNHSTKKIIFNNCKFETNDINDINVQEVTPTDDIKAILKYICNISAQLCYYSIFNSDSITLHLNPSVGVPLQECLNFMLSNRVTTVELEDKKIDLTTIILLSEVQADEVEFRVCIINCINFVPFKKQSFD